MDLNQLQQQIGDQSDKLPPVDKWNPSFCGDIDMRIKHDGTWWYMGTPIGRKALVRLFSTVIKKEDDTYFLVTPVEKVGIQVEDVPFIVTQWQQTDDGIAFTTLTEDTFLVSENHPVKLMQDQTTGAELPYVNVRRNLWARLHQNVFYQLANIGIPQELDGQQQLVIKSRNYAFSLGHL
ncbi:DUF1285 domain-containing protein [Alteromonadaceae bacterium M269]|nr:DUF1285 domain-containing protein [Alteromonadaceae bacterium M269]